MRRTVVPFVVILLASTFNASAQVPLSPTSDAEPLAALDEPLRLDVPRDEASQDRVTAAALLAYGRMLQQRRDFLGALRRYERAYRYDAQQRGLKEIVTLAIDQGRTEEAARYAAIAGDKLGDSIVLRRLAVDATNRRNFKLAARLYEGALKPEGTPGARAASQVLLRAELGRLYFLTGDYERASKSFAEVRAALAKPDDYDLNDSLQKIILGDRSATYGLMARSALESKQYDDALTLFREAHRDAPESEEALLDEIRVAERREDFAAAEKLLDKVLSKGSLQSPSAIELLRRVLGKTTPAEQLETAIEARLQPLHTAHPENEVLRRELARAHFNQGKLGEADALLTDPAVAKPSDELRLLLAAVERMQNNPARWLATTGELVVSGSLATVEEEVAAAAKDEAFAPALLKAAAEMKPSSPGEEAVLRVAALVALERKQADDASRLWEAALPADPAARGQSLLLWGLRLTQADQYERSMQVLQRVVEEKLLPDDSAPTWFYLSGAAALAGKHDAALEAARKAIEARPDDVRFLAREAWVLHRAKRHAEARTKYESLLKKFARSNDTEVRNSLRESRLALSVICVELGDASAAIEFLEEVLDEFPEDVGAMNDLGYVWADRGLHLQRALRMVQTAVAVEPENKAYRDSLGWVYYRLGRFAEAVVELEKATAGDDPGGVILDHLGDALTKTGRVDDARTAWTKALESFRKDGDVEQAAKVEKKLAD